MRCRAFQASRPAAVQAADSASHRKSDCRAGRTAYTANPEIRREREPMRKAWLVGGVAAITLAGIVSVVVSRATSSGADGAGGKKGKVPEVALEFTAQEVVRPQNAAMPLRIEFSGPLVAPRTAVVRAKAAGTLVDAERGRRQPGARRTVARLHRPGQTCSRAWPSASRSRRVGAGGPWPRPSAARSNERLAAAELHLADGAGQSSQAAARRRARPAQVGPGPARHDAHRHSRGGD